MNDPPPGAIPARLLRPGLTLQQVMSLLNDHGARIRNVDNHHWQISLGERSALWMTGDGHGDREGAIDGAALLRLERVLRQNGLLREEHHPLATAAASRPMGAAIVWIGPGATRVYWINDQELAQGTPHSLGHWLHGEFTLHRTPRSVPYLCRIEAMLERIERALLIGQAVPAAAVTPAGADAPPPCGPAPAETGAQARGGGEDLLGELLNRLRPELRRRVVGVVSLEGERLDDALLFAMARDYLIPHGTAPAPH